MEIIRKKICLEKSRSRKQGLLPFIPYNVDVSGERNPFITPDNSYVNGNWGGFVVNPAYMSGGTLVVKNYMNLVRSYNIAIEIAHTGTFAKKITKHGTTMWTTYQDNDKTLYDFKPVPLSKFTKVNSLLFEQTSGDEITDDFVNIIENYSEFIKHDDDNYTKCKLMDGFVGKLRVPREYDGEPIDGELVRDEIAYCDILPKIEELEKYENKTDCCSLKEWNKRGGAAMLKFLRDNKDLYETAVDNVDEYLMLVNGAPIYECIPKISVPILITGDTYSIGVMASYLEEGIDYKYSGVTGSWLDNIEDYVVESKLSTLRVSERFYDDEGNELPGIFRTFNKESQGVEYDSALFYYNHVTEKWEDSASNLYPDEYEMAEVAATIPSTASTEMAFIVRYDNSPSSPMDIPYEVNRPKNVYSVFEASGNEATRNGKKEFVGDFILEITYPSETRIKFKYVLGGHFLAEKVTDGDNTKYVFSEYVENTGIVYIEEHGYAECESDTFNIDGQSGVTLYYNYVDFSGEVTMFENEDYGLTRGGITGNIVAYNTMDVYKKNYVYGASVVTDLNTPAILGELFDYDVACVYTFGHSSSQEIIQNMEYSWIIRSISEDGSILAKSRDGRTTAKFVRREELDIGLEDGKLYTWSILIGYDCEVIDAPVYKPEYLIGITDEIKSKVNIVVDRGAAGAFETHFKLSECNTLEDIENYGNNYFNI